MIIKGKSEGYAVYLDAGEKIKILINDNEIYAYTVPEGKHANIGYTMSETDKPE